MPSTPSKPTTVTASVPAAPAAPAKHFATPDISLAQIAAGVLFVVTQAIAWGVIDDNTGELLVSIAGIVLPAALAIADAIIRHGRATGNAHK